MVFMYNCIRVTHNQYYDKLLGQSTATVDIYDTHMYIIYIVLPPLTKFYYMHMTCNLHVYQSTDMAYKIPFYI